jgi:hypothetical protein
MKERITIHWDIADIHYIDQTLSKDDCFAVLEMVEQSYNKHVGINWNIIENTIALYRASMDDDPDILFHSRERELGL